MTPTHIPEGNYYTLEELAQMYNVARRTAQQWIEKGWLKSIYFGGAHHIEAGQLEGFSRPKPGSPAKQRDGD
jgi:excisionase family DNA binding protein